MKLSPPPPWKKGDPLGPSLISVLSTQLCLVPKILKTGKTTLNYISFQYVERQQLNCLRIHWWHWSVCNFVNFTRERGYKFVNFWKSPAYWCSSPSSEPIYGITTHGLLKFNKRRSIASRYKCCVVKNVILCFFLSPAHHSGSLKPDITTTTCTFKHFWT